VTAGTQKHPELMLDTLKQCVVVSEFTEFCAAINNVDSL
jgi:hypothetical protein